MAVEDGVKRVNRDGIKNASRKLLKSKGAVLWSRAWDIHDEEGLDAAAEWLTDQVVPIVLDLGVTVNESN